MPSDIATASPRGCNTADNNTMPEATKTASAASRPIVRDRHRRAAGARRDMDMAPGAIAAPGGNPFASPS